MSIPAPLIAHSDDCVPVTIHLTHAQVARTEALIVALRQRHPGIDDNDATDSVYLVGLSALE